MESRSRVARVLICSIIHGALEGHHAWDLHPKTENAPHRPARCTPRFSALHPTATAFYQNYSPLPRGVSLKDLISFYDTPLFIFQKVLCPRTVAMPLCCFKFAAKRRRQAGQVYLHLLFREKGNGVTEVTPFPLKHRILSILNNPVILPPCIWAAFLWVFRSYSRPTKFSTVVSLMK